MMVAGQNMDESRLIKQKTAKPLLWVGLVGITMIFASLTSAYIVRQAEPDWLSIELPQPFFISTGIILLSSVALIIAARRVKASDYNGTSIWLGITLLLGIGFVIAQFYTYSYMVKEGYYFVGTNVSSSFLYVLTGLHLVHVAGGIIALAWVFVRSLQKYYSADNRLGIQLASTYWHYLAVLWIYLMLFLMYIK